MNAVDLAYEMVEAFDAAGYLVRNPEARYRAWVIEFEVVSDVD